MYDVLAFGSYSIDLVFTGLPRLPRLGEDIQGTGFEMIPGEAYNTAVAMHRLGIKVGWAADFGSDEFSRFTLERVRLEGMDESLFVHHDRPLRRISIAASFPHDRAFITYYDPAPEIPAYMKALPRVSARIVYIPGFVSGRLMEAGSNVARLKKMVRVMDGNSGEGISLASPEIRRALQHVDIFLPNAAEARRIAGEDEITLAIRKLGELCPYVVVKDGPNGAYALTGGRLYHAAGIPVTPVDTTGAGDCFNAGFLRGYLDGDPPDTCLKMGNIVGGLSTTAPGGTGRRVTMQDIQEWMELA